MKFKEFGLLLEDNVPSEAMDDLIDASLETASDPEQAKKTLAVLDSLAHKIAQTIQTYSDNHEPEEPAADTAEPTEPADQEPPAEPEPEQDNDMPDDQDELTESTSVEDQVQAKLLLVNQMREQAINNPALLALIDQMAETHAAEIERIRTQSYSSGVEAGRQEIKTEYASLDKYVHLMLERLPLKDNNKKTIVAVIKSIFQDDDIPPEDAKNFLEAAAEGKVIDMVALLKAGQGNITNFVRSDLVKTFKKVIDDFFKLDLGSSTGGNIGPGEIAFILLGNPVAKVKKGDLQIGEGDTAEKFEIKSSGIKSDKGKSGSVFGGDHISTGKALWPEIKKILNRYGIHHTEDTKVNASGKTKSKTKKVPRFKLNTKGLEQFNDAFKINQLGGANIAALLTEIALTLYPESEDPKVITKRIASILKANGGQIDTGNNGAFMRLLTRLALNTYRMDEGKDNFIYFNQTTKNFHVYMGNELDQELESPEGDLEVMRGIDWGDGHYKASPGLYLK